MIRFLGVLIFVTATSAGSLRYPRAQEEDVLTSDTDNATQLWEGAVVPYMLHSSLSSQLKEVFLLAAAHVEEKSCVRFIERETENDFVLVTDKGRCSSTQGRAGGRQTLSISSLCGEVGRVVHELLHCLGFPHEHSRADRDSFVKINFSNIQTDKAHDFAAYSRLEQDLGLVYDYGSIMHYDLWAFSKNGYQTIAPLREESGVRVGQRDMLSGTDSLKINTIYSCRESNMCEKRGMCLKGRCERQSLYTYQCRCYSGYFGDRCQLAAASCGNGEHQCESDKRCVPSTQRCDGVKQCVDGSDEMHCGSCTFERFCPWRWTKDGDVSWLLRSGPTPSRPFGTGPAVDHTTGNLQGKYIYLESSKPSYRGDRAVLSSRALVAGNYSLTLWYHMFGVNVGALSAVLLQGDKNVTLFEIKGNQGDSWRSKEVTFSSTTSSRVQLVGVVGSGYRGDIAVDDINLTNTNTRQLIPAQTHCVCLNGGVCRTDGTCLCRSNFTGVWCESEITPCSLYPCSLGQCVLGNGGTPVCTRLDKTATFEESNQSVWETNVTAKDTYSWIRVYGPGTSPKTGPKHDHTFGNATGNYMLMKSKDRKYNGQKAWLTSLPFTESKAACSLQFWYFMRGGEVGHLSVYLKYEGSAWSLLWTVDGPQGTKWKQADVPIGQRYHFRVAIVGSAEYGSEGDIAVDDVLFKECFQSKDLKISAVSPRRQHVDLKSHVYLDIAVDDPIPDLRHHITWRRGEEIIKSGENRTYLRDNNRQLVLRSLDVPRFGTYSVTVTYAGAGRVLKFRVLTRDQELTTSPAPNSTTAPVVQLRDVRPLLPAVQVSEGEDVVLGLQLFPDTGVFIDIAWFSGNHLLTEDKHFSMSDRSKKLVIEHSTQQDEGQYVAVVRTQSQQFKVLFNVTVKRTSKYIQSLVGTKMVVQAGQDVEIPVRFTGVKPPYWHVFWSKVSPNYLSLSPPPSGGHYKTPDNRRKCIISNIQQPDTGIYRVEVRHNGVQDFEDIEIIVK